MEETWRIVQPLLDSPPAVETYKPGSWGPTSADTLLSGYPRWRQPWTHSHAARSTLSHRDTPVRFDGFRILGVSGTELETAQIDITPRSRSHLSKGGLPDASSRYRRRKGHGTKTLPVYGPATRTSGRGLDRSKGPPMSSVRTPPHGQSEVNTLAVDIGGTGLKASVLDLSGNMEHDRVRVPTPYPLSPVRLVDEIERLIEPLPPFDRVSVGFPGMVRDGHVLSAPHFVSPTGPGGKPSPKLTEAWARFDLRGRAGAGHRQAHQGGERRRRPRRRRRQRAGVRGGANARHGTGDRVLPRGQTAAALRVLPPPVPQRPVVQRSHR